MEIPDYEPFYLESLGELRAEIARLGLEIPVEEDLGKLKASAQVGAKQVPNRFCQQPLSGNDAMSDGSPGELTLRRYQRYATGGFGLIWIESTAAGRPGRPGQLVLNDANRERFRSLVKSIRTHASERWQREIVVILQLSVPYVGSTQAFPGLPPDAPLILDDEIATCRDHLVGAATLAAEAGFDGIDVQSCRGALAGRLLSAFERQGEFGGSFENRTRFLRDTISRIREACPDLLIATRLNAYDAVRFPYGFGVDQSDYRKEDLSEPVRLVQELKEAGLDLLNVNSSNPNLQGTPSDRPVSPIPDGGVPDEHPLTVLARQLRIAESLKNAAPGLPVVGSGFSWLRQFVPEVAAGAIGAGAMDFAGLGRSALAYPNAPAEIFEHGRMRAESSCMVCFACSTLRDERKPVGCVIRDPEIYGESWQGARRLPPEQLEEEARRCHFCEAAPCIAACPAHTDIPGFIKAYLAGDDRRAFEIIRSHDVLPEMTAHLSPGWLQSEGACIETALTGYPVPILDLQHAISWRAREQGETGLHLSGKTTGHRVAIVGGGPAGIAAAIRLLELGHEVDLYEQTDSLGGTPQRAIPSSRVPDFLPEIEAVIAPAIEAKRLRFHFGKSLGGNLELEPLRSGADALLLAVGVWRERSLGVSARGVVNALDFLEAVKKGERDAVPKRVAVLSGGDSAMDAADTVQRLGAEKVIVVFGGPRSEMHWHMPEEWFETPGVETMMKSQPIGYEMDDSGNVSGLRFHEVESDQESILSVGLVIEAMGLEVSETVRESLSALSLDREGKVITSDGCRTNLDLVYAAGGLVNGGASVGQCVAEGMKAAEAIHADLP